jgi:phage terminase large subunit-like protein
MTTLPTASIYESFASLPPNALRRELGRLKTEELEALWWSWRAQARPNQLLPLGTWSTWLVCAGRGWGKALDLKTPIPTPTGWTTMGDLHAGDEIFSEAGIPCRVIFATEIQYGHECYRIVFDDGEDIVADAEHLWLTLNKKSRKSARRGRVIVPAVQTTREILGTLYDGRDRNHSIPLTAPLMLPEQALPLPPYALGVWLGDGDSKAAMITVHDSDSEIVDLVRKAGVTVHEHVNGRDGSLGRYLLGRQPYQRSITTGRMEANGSFHSQLKALGLIRNKHIPVMYLRGSIEQRWQLLFGLMDTDGHAVKSSNHVEFSSTRRALADGVLELARSLGIKARLYERRARLYGRDCGEAFRVRWSSRQPCFALTRKAAQRRVDATQESRTKQRFIVAVEPLPSVPVRCIQVDSPSHLFLAGRGMIPTHNTRTGSETIRQWVRDGAKRIALVAATPGDARDVMIEGQSGLLNIYPERERPAYQPSLRRVVWPVEMGGAHATIYSAHKHEDKSGLRGPQHEKAWGDEPAKWQYPGNLDQLMLGLRLGEAPQAVLTGTPRAIPLIRNLIRDSRQPQSLVRVTVGSTYENRGILSDAWFDLITKKYAGTRLGQQELLAKILEDVEGALWTLPMIQASYDEVSSFSDDGYAQAGRPINQALRDSMERVVVAVDPSVGDGKPVDLMAEQTAETGIIVCGRRARQGHLLDDQSLYAHPSQWAKRVVETYARWQADYIVAEKNNGGELVRLTIQSVPGARSIPVKLVTASRGKYTRAEPVALLHERGAIRHHAAFPELEDQLTTWVPGMKSPDRLDAYVWGMTELLVDLMEFGIASYDEVVPAESPNAQLAHNGQGQAVDPAIQEALQRGGLYFPERR